MARNVYTVRVIDYPAYLAASVSPVEIESQWIIHHMTATPNLDSVNWENWNSPLLVRNGTTEVAIWRLAPMQGVLATFHWVGRYVLEYGEELQIAAPGWDVSITAYSLALP